MGAVGIILGLIGYFMNVPVTKDQRIKEARQAIQPDFDQRDTCVSGLRNTVKEYGFRIDAMESRLDAMADCRVSWLGSARSSLDSGLVTIGLKKYESAIIHLTYAITGLHTDDSVRASAYFYRGVAHLALKDTALALTDWDSTVVHDSLFIVAWNNRSASLWHYGKYEASVSSANQALRIQACYGEALANKASAFLGIGEFDSTISCAAQALGCGFDHPSLRHTLAIAQKRVGQYADAVHNYNASLLMDSLRREVWHDKAIALHAWGDSEFITGDTAHAIELVRSAITSLTVAIRLDPTYYKAYAERARCHGTLGESCDAIVDFAAALKIAPADWDERKNVIELRKLAERTCHHSSRG